jgi:hypothetical protein
MYFSQVYPRANPGTAQSLISAGACRQGSGLAKQAVLTNLSEARHKPCPDAAANVWVLRDFRTRRVSFFTGLEFILCHQRVCPKLDIFSPVGLDRECVQIYTNTQPLWSAL